MRIVLFRFPSLRCAGALGRASRSAACAPARGAPTYSRAKGRAREKAMKIGAKRTAGSDFLAHDGPETRVEHVRGDGAGGVVRDVAAHARAQAFGREMAGGERGHHVGGGGRVEAGQVRRAFPHAV